MSNKFSTLMAQLETEVFAVEPNFANSLLGSLEVYKHIGVSPHHTEIANNSVTYQVIGDCAVIALDGVMYKKNIGLCTSVISYDQIVKNINKAEADENVKTIIFRVDTRGGSVAGAEEVRNRIKNSPKKTITFFENVGASGGMWIFTASDEVYATDMTQLGSIGVIVIYRDRKTDLKTIVSLNAPNKYCDIADPKCKQRVQADINKYEAKFLEVLVEAYPNKTKEQIIDDFDRGGVIFGEEAYKLGYLDGVMQFQELLETKVSKEAIEKNKTRSIKMAEDNIFKVEQLEEQLSNANATIENLQKEVDTSKEQLSLLISEREKLQEEIAKITHKLEVAKHAVAMSLERGVTNKEVVLRAMEATDKLNANDIVASFLASTEATYIGEDPINEDMAIDGLSLKAKLRRKGEL